MKRALEKEAKLVEAPKASTWEKIRKNMTFPVEEQKLKNDFPSDLTRLSFQELGRLNSLHTARLVFINEKMAESKHEVRRRKLDFLNLRSRLIFVTKGPFKAKVFAAVNCDERVQEARDDLLQASAAASVWGSILWSTKGFLRAIEFEVERRKAVQYAEGGGADGRPSRR